MELGTFGAIIGFALGVEERAADFYDSAAEGEMAALFSPFAARSRERVKRLERARRELVSEMILESITGLDGDDYQVAPGFAADRAGLLHEARTLEETTARFYQDAASKMPIREVVRLFRRLAAENDQRRAALPDQ